MLSRTALLFIRFYQIYLSPHKGYRCAYGVLHNNGTCSSRVSDIIEHQGVIAGWSQIKHQFAMCTEAYEELKDRKKRKRQEEEKKEGSKWECCDPGIACDVISCIPKPRSFCKGKDIDGNCDLPCDCSF